MPDSAVGLQLYLPRHPEVSVIHALLVTVLRSWQTQALEFLFVALFVGDVPLTAFAALSMGRCAQEWLAERRAVAAQGAAAGQEQGRGRKPSQHKGRTGEQHIETLVAADIVAGGTYASGIEMNTTIILGVSGIALLCHVWLSGVLSSVPSRQSA